MILTLPPGTQPAAGFGAAAAALPLSIARSVRTGRRIPSRLLSAVLALLVAALVPARASAAPDLEPKILLHVERASLSHPCQPAPGSCAAAITEGGLYTVSGAGNYYVFLLAARFDPERGIREIHTGIHFDFTTGAGVDIYEWFPCADSETFHEWYTGGGDNRMSWNAENCQTDSLAVGGYFYMTAYTPGPLALIPPSAGAASVTWCDGAVETVPAARLGYAGFGDVTGCSPCLTPCDYVPVATTSWSGIKALFR